VIVVENHAVPLATVLIAVRNGAFTQDSRSKGSPTCTSTAVSDRTRGRPDAFGIEVTRHERRL